MIICKNCGAESRYIGSACPQCNKKFTFDYIDIENTRSILEDAQKNKQYDEALECYHILADYGDVDAQRQYAKCFEKGSIAPKDFNVATEYYGRAAKKNDSYSAYKYSRLIMRENDATGRFWLIFSAILGAKDAYVETAEEFSAMGNESDANYFYSLAAACDDVDSIVTIAKRYYKGIGIEEPAPKYAKWYMDKLTIPPIYAIKLAYKLRGIAAEEPPIPTLKNYDGLLRKMCEQAKSCGFDTAYFRLSEILADRGNESAAVTVGDALVRGIGCTQNLEAGLKALTKSAAQGNIDANLALGRLYLDGKAIEKNEEIALRHYIRAGELGSANGYKTCADILVSLDEDGKYIAEAVNFYDLAAELGSAEAREKSDIIKLERDKYYRAAIAHEKINPETAFNYYAMSSAMGHTAATFKLAECYRCGIGTKENRTNAFTWYKKAAELGENDALYPLGICYMTGYGTALDFDMAKKTLIKAERVGDERAHDKIISMMQRKMKTVARHLYSSAMRLMHMQKFDVAMTHLEISAELENPKALYTLGCLYEFGICTPCNKNKAYALYEKAYARTFRDPRSRYKLRILKMIKYKR